MAYLNSLADGGRLKNGDSGTCNDSNRCDLNLQVSVGLVARSTRYSDASLEYVVASDARYVFIAQTSTELTLKAVVVTTAVTVCNARPLKTVSSSVRVLRADAPCTHDAFGGRDSLNFRRAAEVSRLEHVVLTAPCKSSESLHGCGGLRREYVSLVSRPRTRKLHLQQRS